MIRKPSQLRTRRSLLHGRSEDLIIPTVDDGTNQLLLNVLSVHLLAVYDISLYHPICLRMIGSSGGMFYIKARTELHPHFRCNCVPLSEVKAA